MNQKQIAPLAISSFLVLAGIYSLHFIGASTPYNAALNDFAAVLNGRVPFFDYWPIRHWLIPYLFTPGFRIFGFSTNVFFAQAGLFALIAAGASVLLLGVSSPQKNLYKVVSGFCIWAFVYFSFHIDVSDGAACVIGVLAFLFAAHQKERFSFGLATLLMWDHPAYGIYLVLGLFIYFGLKEFRKTALEFFKCFLGGTLGVALLFLVKSGHWISPVTVFVGKNSLSLIPSREDFVSVGLAASSLILGHYFLQNIKSYNSFRFRWSACLMLAIVFCAVDMPRSSAFIPSIANPDVHSLVRKYSDPMEQVVILAPNHHALALKIPVEDLFMWGNAEEFRDELNLDKTEHLLGEMKIHSVRHVFGVFGERFKQKLIERGYELKEKSQDFVAWEKPYPKPSEVPKEESPK